MESKAPIQGGSQINAQNRKNKQNNKEQWFFHKKII